jgi:hypothetical protein
MQGVLDVDGSGGVGGTVRVVGDDHGDRFPGVADDAVRERGVPVRPQRRRRDEGDGAPALGQVVDREDGRDAGQPAGGAGVDADDARVGVRAANDGGVQHARHPHVVEIPAAAGDEAEVFLAPDRSAERRRHGPVAV